MLNGHCSIPFRNVKIFAFIVPEQLSFLWSGDSVSTGKALEQFIGQTTRRNAESGGIIKKLINVRCKKRGDDTNISKY